MGKYDVAESENSIVYWPYHSTGQAVGIFAVASMVFSVLMIGWLIFEGYSSKNVGLIIFLSIIIIISCVMVAYVNKIMYIKVRIDYEGIHIIRERKCEVETTQWEMVSEIRYYKDNYYGTEFWTLDSISNTRSTINKITDIRNFNKNGECSDKTITKVNLLTDNMSSDCRELYYYIKDI